jgi:hypothetical protein
MALPTRTLPGALIMVGESAFVIARHSGPDNRNFARNGQVT